MNILLIRTVPKGDVFGAESFLPLGIGYIAAVLEKTGHAVKILDLTIQKLTDGQIIEMVINEKIELVGFSSVTLTVKSAYRIAGLLKEKTNVITVMGGPHATALPEEPLLHKLDFVVRGEGEETMQELCAGYKDPGKIAGISYLHDGKIVHTASRPYINNLDLLPFPARHLFPPLKLYKGQQALGNRLPVGNILTSRGCPYECTFCFKAVFGRHFRARSVESVISEWKHLLSVHKVKEISIIDDSFTTSTERVMAICKRIVEEKLVLPWCCPNGIRVDNASFELLSAMRKAGCYRVAFGVESGSQRILDSIGKKITLGQIEAAFLNAKKAGIETTAFLMMGNLEEDRETIQQTIDFAKKIAPTYVQFLIAIPYPGSLIYEEVKRNGKLMVKDWDEYGEYDEKFCFEYKKVNAILIDEMYKKAYREYYLRPGYIIKQLFNQNTYRYFGKRARAFFRFLK